MTHFHILHHHRVYDFMNSQEMTKTTQNVQMPQEVTTEVAFLKASRLTGDQMSRSWLKEDFVQKGGVRGFRKKGGYVLCCDSNAVCRSKRGRANIEIL